MSGFMLLDQIGSNKCAINLIQKVIFSWVYIGPGGASCSRRDHERSTELDRLEELHYFAME